MVISAIIVYRFSIFLPPIRGPLTDQGLSINRSMTAHYQIILFGSGQVLDSQQKSISIRSRKTLALLSYLAVEQAVPHRRDFLMGLLWPEMAEADARNNLRVTLANLRKVFAQADSALILADRHTVHFNISSPHGLADRGSDALSDVWLDVYEFQRQRKRGAKGGYEGSESLARASALYQGEFLQGFHLEACEAFEEWLLITREQLYVHANEVQVQLINHYRATGDHAAAEKGIRRWLVLDPFQEEAHRQLMELLARNGRRQAALVQYENWRQLLKTEMGLSPSVEMVTLYQQIRDETLPTFSPATSSPSNLLNVGSSEPTQDVGSDGHFGSNIEVDSHLPSASNAQSLSAAQSVPPVLRHNLPQKLTPFIGRAQELQQLEERLSDPAYRLISLVGPGGIGKSRLAVEAATQQLSQYADGVFFVPLAEIQSAELIPAAVASALGLTLQRSAQTPAEQLFEILEEKHLLIILDNIEHLVDGAEVLLSLLQRAQNIVLLVTSREVLDVQAEDLFLLDGLPVPENASSIDAAQYASLQLFWDRACRLDKTFALDDQTLPSVIHICQLVDGLPLGIELAATWIRDWALDDIVAELTQGLDGLETTLRDISPQHHSLRAVFNTSWALLSPLEQKALAQLSIFRGGFTIEAAQATTVATRPLVTQLRNKSLLRSDGSRRYGIHPFVQQLARERLDQLAEPALPDAPDTCLARQTVVNHARYYLSFLHQNEATMLGATPRSTAARIRHDIENVRQAWDSALESGLWCELTQGLMGFTLFFEWSGLYGEGISRLHSALDQVAVQLASRSKPNDALQRLQVDLILAWTELMQSIGFHSDTDQKLEEALTLSKQLEYVFGEMCVYLALGRNRLNRADNETALVVFKQAYKLARREGFARHEGIILRNLGNVWRQRSDYAAFEEHLQNALSIQRKIGHLSEVHTNLTWLGVYRELQGDIWGGRQFLEEALQLNDEIDMDQQAYILHSCMARSDAQLGYYDHALQQLAKTATFYQAIDDAFHLIWNQLTIIAVHIEMEMYDSAVSLAHSALDLALQRDSHEHVASLQTLLGYAQCELQAFDEALSYFQQAAEAWQKINNEARLFEAKVGYAYVSFQLGNCTETQSEVDSIVSRMEEGNLYAAICPHRIYWNAYQLLKDMDDPRAGSVLETVHSLIERQASLITDASSRTHFLENVSLNGAILTEFELTYPRLG